MRLTRPGQDAGFLGINRELSLREFNQRVLAQALDESVPPLERAEVPVDFIEHLDADFRDPGGGISALSSELGSLAPDGLSIPEQLSAIHDARSSW